MSCLILTRRWGEAIVIGDADDKVVIKVLGNRGGNVRLGIEAARHIRVDRAEVRGRHSE